MTTNERCCAYSICDICGNQQSQTFAVLDVDE